MNRIHMTCELVCTALLFFVIGMVLSLDVIAACAQCHVPCCPHAVLTAGGVIFGCLGSAIKLLKIIRR